MAGCWCHGLGKRRVRILDFEDLALRQVIAEPFSVSPGDAGEVQPEWGIRHPLAVPGHPHCYAGDAPASRRAGGAGKKDPVTFAKESPDAQAGDRDTHLGEGGLVADLEFARYDSPPVRWATECRGGRGTVVTRWPTGLRARSFRRVDGDGLGAAYGSAHDLGGDVNLVTELQLIQDLHPSRCKGIQLQDRRAGGGR